MKAWIPKLEEFVTALQGKVTERDENAYVVLQEVDNQRAVILIHTSSPTPEAYVIMETPFRTLTWQRVQV